MKQIELDSIYLKGFRSYRQGTRIDFGDQPGLFYLAGKNLVEPRLGSNGAGKSSLFEALNWCLQGVSSDNDRAADLASWGAEQPEVEVMLYINNESARINRKGSPNRLTINERPAEQIDLDRLIGLDRPRFQQAVLFGQFADLFMELSVAKRGELLDDVLSLEYWLKLSDAASEDARSFQWHSIKANQELARVQGQLAELADEAVVQKHADEWDDNRRSELSAAIQEVADKEDEESALKATLDKLRKTPLSHAGSRSHELDGVREKVGRLRGELSGLARESDALFKRGEFYVDHEECPTCHQRISAEIRKQVKEELALEFAHLRTDKDVKQAELDQQLLWLKENEGKIRDAEIEWRTCEREIEQTERMLHLVQRDIDRLVERAERIGNNDTNPFLIQLQELKSRRTTLKQAERLIGRELLGLKTKIEKANYWKAGFKRVRLFIIRRILRSLELEVQAAAAALGLPGWQISFATETETKSGSIRHGVQVEVKSPAAPGAWSKWSGGEGQRIKLAVNIGLSNLIQKMAGVEFAFEVWDEPSQHLSSEGVEDLFNCLDYRAQTTGKQIWVVDHVAANYAGFSEVWQVTKDQAGSHLARV